MKDEKQQDNRICLYYVTERLIDLTKIKTEKELKIKLYKFKDECVHNLGINALHNHNN